jgi:protein HOOK3
LTAEGELDRIRSGKGDESEVAFALRTMLNSCEKELFQAKNELTEKEVVFEQTKKELAVAQSDRK